MPMATTTQAAKLAGIGVSTVRHYAREWPDYLSPSATPAPGETRQFTAQDVAVFKTISTLRKQGATTEDIKAALDSGERYEPLDIPPEVEDVAEDETAESQPGRALATIELLERFVRPYQDRIETLETRLEDERTARLSAEIRATRVETELEILLNRGKEDKPPRWQFWKR